MRQVDMTWLRELFGNLIGAVRRAVWFDKTLPREDPGPTGDSPRVGVANRAETNDTQDWRWTGQDEYLAGVELRFSRYEPYREDRDHDHCEFCWAKFLPVDQAKEWSPLTPGDAQVLVTEGYTTTESYPQGAEWFWICQGCFDDFDDLVDWVVVN